MSKDDCSLLISPFQEDLLDLEITPEVLKPEPVPVRWCLYKYEILHCIHPLSFTTFEFQNSRIPDDLQNTTGKELKKTIKTCTGQQQLLLQPL